MSLPADFRARLLARAAHAGVDLSADVLERLIVYAELLALWNRRINLTAFDLSAPTDEAIDRLLVEPVAAAPLVRSADRRAIDLGSGGGSPAVPFAVAVKAIEMTMVEVRAKKAAFLREVVRTLSLQASVEVARFEDVALASGGVFDLVTLRAVRADGNLWRAVDRLLAPRGLVFWFGGVGQTTEKWFIDDSSVGTTRALCRRNVNTEDAEARSVPRGTT